MKTGFYSFMYTGEQYFYKTTGVISSITSVGPAIQLSRNARKQSQNMKNKNYIAWYFGVTFFVFCASFFAFRILQHFTPGLAFVRKVKGFPGLFSRSINKTRNLLEMRKVYSECFVFRDMFRKNICEIPVKCEIQKCIDGLICAWRARIELGGF